MPAKIYLLKIFFILIFVVLFLRLGYWQIYKGRELSIQARSQYQSGSSSFAPRGRILSSDSSLLAASGEAWLIYAEVNKLEEDPKQISEKLAPLFVEDANDKKKLAEEVERLNLLLSKKGSNWVALKSRVETDVKKKIEEFKIKGIGFEKQERRIYPEASSAAHLLGFVGKDRQGEDIGYFGLEGYYNVVLSGKPGFIGWEKDASGIPIPLAKKRRIEPIKGVDLQTHIDKSIQFILERKLSEGVKKYSAQAGLAVVVEPKSGAVLGMASYPTYDPSRYWEFNDELFLNPVISSSFEPGSIFKVLVMAAALDAKVVDRRTICDICTGPVRVDKYTIETWNKVYHPNSNMQDIIVNSDNVGMVFVAQKLGVERLYEYLERFKFGQKTGIDLQGESSPPLREKGKWSQVDLATAGFGQGIAVTPIQMIMAVSAIANRGVLVKPQVVDKIIGEGWEEDIKPEVLGRVVSEEAAEEVTLMMAEAAKKGESKWTNISGFKIAGKTGTAQIPIAGHYDEEKTIASFVGFVPYDDPKFAMLVTLKEPSSSPWASETAAPLWYSIATDLFDYFKIQPEI